LRSEELICSISDPLSNSEPSNAQHSDFQEVSV